MADVKEFNINGTVYDIKDATARSGLSGKADTGLTNVSDTGTSKGAGWAMPSSTYEDLTVGASGTTYTAPANGYFYAGGLNTSTVGPFIALTVNQGQGMQGMTTISRDHSVPTNNGLFCFLPVKKGTVVRCEYSGVNIGAFEFIYAEGSESEYTPSV